MKIYKGKWGIIIDDLEKKTLEKIPERLAKLKITDRMRKSNVMDRDIGKYEELIDVALEEAKKKKGKKIIISQFTDYKDATKLKNRIKVYNKGASPIYRGGYVFPAGETSKELVINMRTYKEIKSHVSLIINVVK